MAFWLVPFRNVYWEADVADDTNALYCYYSTQGTLGVGRTESVREANLDVILGGAKRKYF